MSTNDEDATGASNEDRGNALARTLLTPGLSNARAIKALEGEKLPEDMGVVHLKEALEDQVASLREDDSTQHQEAMLADQAVTLQTLFVRLIERAEAQTVAEHYRTLLHLALRAQNQSRATLQALSNVRSPRSQVFAKQANVANNQQINHAQSAEDPSAETLENTQTGLLDEQPNEQWLDTRAPSQAGAGNSTMAPLDTLDRTQDG